MIQIAVCIISQRIVSELDDKSAQLVKETSGIAVEVLVKAYCSFQRIHKSMNFV